MKIGAILEARIESERLPGKMLFPMLGIPAVMQVVDRVIASRGIHSVVIACPDTPINRVMDQIFKDTELELDIAIYHGPMDDVLKRTLLAAKENNIDVIVSITCDCPLIDPKHIDFLLEKYFTHYDQYKYVSNIHPRSWPDGLDIQIYSTRLLGLADLVVKNPIHRRHSGWNIYSHRFEIENLIEDERIPIKNYSATKKYYWPNLGLTFDQIEDYELICTILDHFSNYHNRFKIEDVIDWLRENPVLICNRDVKRKVPGEG